MMKHKKSSIERSQDSLFSKLKKLKDCNILKHSINPEDASSDFEILEFYGDSVLYERMAFFLMKTRRFMCPDLLTKMRQECINNRNLALCFDILNLRELTSYSSTPDKVLLTKAKADVIEAIIGELAESIERGDSTVREAEAKSVLEELLAYISYTGEKEFFAMGSPAIAQSTPVATPHRKSPSPPHQQQKAPSPSKSATPALQKSPSPPANACPPPLTPAIKMGNKQSYKNNMPPHHKATKKQPPLPLPTPTQVASFPLPQPALPLPTPSAYPKQLVVLTHEPIKPISIPREPVYATPLPSPSPYAMFRSDLHSPASEILLGGRNVAVFTAT